MLYVVIAIVASVTFFNSCVTMLIKIRNGEDVGRDRVFASTMLIIALFIILPLIIG